MSILIPTDHSVTFRFFARERHNQINKNISLERARVYIFFFFLSCDFITLLCHIGMKRNLFCRKKIIKHDFLHGRTNFAKELTDKHCALFQSSPKLNRMLITRLICIQRKQSRSQRPRSFCTATTNLSPCSQAMFTPQYSL